MDGIEQDKLIAKSILYLETLCETIGERPVGSYNNQKATQFFKQELLHLGWETLVQKFEAMDWVEKGVSLSANGTFFNAQTSPYSKGCKVKAILKQAGTVEELENGNYRDSILLLHGEIAQEQLMPKNFVFYNPESHQKIVSLLEASGANALICATGRNVALAGGVYPFPLIEDGDFDIPSVYMTEEEGARLLPHVGQQVDLQSLAERIPAKGYNVTGIKGDMNAERIVVTAHIDTKTGTPGAIDNATGVVVLLLLAELLKNYTGTKTIELVAFNGEDYYSVPGQMAWIRANEDKFGQIIININIDGAGYKNGQTTFSFFELPLQLQTLATEIVNTSSGITEGVQWPQGDHSIFVQYGRPAIAVSSKFFIDNMETQDITHTPKDNLSIVDPGKLVEIANSLFTFISKL